jgi:hypothetical protein
MDKLLADANCNAGAEARPGTIAEESGRLVGLGILPEVPIKPEAKAPGARFDKIGDDIRKAFISGRGNDIANAFGEFSGNPMPPGKVQGELSLFLNDYAKTGGLQTAISVADGRVTLYREYRDIEQELYSRPYNADYDTAINKAFDDPDYRKGVLKGLGLEKDTTLFKSLDDPARLELYLALKDKNGMEFETALSRFKDTDGADKGKVDYAKLIGPLNKVLDMLGSSNGRSPFIVTSNGDTPGGSQLTVSWNKYPRAVALNTFTIKKTNP